MNTSDGTGTEELCIFHDPRSFPAILAGGGNDKVLHPMIIHDVFVRALCIFKGRRKRGERIRRNGGSMSDALTRFRTFFSNLASGEPVKTSLSGGKRALNKTLRNFVKFLACSAVQGLAFVMTQNVVGFFFGFFSIPVSHVPSLHLPSPVYMCLRVCSPRLPALVYTGPLVLSFALARPYLLRQRPPGHQRRSASPASYSPRPSAHGASLHTLTSRLCVPLSFPSLLSALTWGSGC